MIPRQRDDERRGEELENGVGDGDGLGDPTGEVDGLVDADEVSKELGDGVVGADTAFGLSHADTSSAPIRATVTTAPDRFLTPRLTRS